MHRGLEDDICKLLSPAIKLRGVRSRWLVPYDPTSMNTLSSSPSMHPEPSYRTAHVQVTLAACGDPTSVARGCYPRAGMSYHLKSVSIHLTPNHDVSCVAPPSPP